MLPHAGLLVFHCTSGFIIAGTIGTARAVCKTVPGTISNPHNTMAVLVPIFQMKKLRLRYMNVFVQGRKQSQESNPKLSASKGPSVFYHPTGPALFLTGPCLQTSHQGRSS